MIHTDLSPRKDRIGTPDLTFSDPYPSPPPTSTVVAQPDPSARLSAVRQDLDDAGVSATPAAAFSVHPEWYAWLDHTAHKVGRRISRQRYNFANFPDYRELANELLRQARLIQQGRRARKWRRVPRESVRTLPALPELPCFEAVAEIADLVIAKLRLEGRQGKFGDQGYRAWRHRRAKRGAAARWGAESAARAERNDKILAARAEGRPVKEVAEEFGLKGPTIKAIATRAAVAAWQERQKVLMPVSPPGPNDFPVKFNQVIESLELRRETGINTIVRMPRRHWILDCWYTNVDAYLSLERADRLTEFADWVEAEELAGNELPNGQGLLWLVDEVIIRRCSTKDHPAAYLMVCIDNHGRSLSAELVRDTVQAVGFDFDRKVQYVAAARNPVAYLTSLRDSEVPNGGLADASPMGVGLITLKRWVPDLVTPDFEAEAQRLLDWERRPGRYVEDYRRRFGRLPWEDQPDSNTSDPEASPRGIPSDAEVEPWPQADPPVKPGKLEHPENPPFSPVPRETRRDKSHGEALKPVERYPSASQNAGAVARLEQAPCRHPLAKMLALVMQLDAIEQVDCAATGCSCTLYSDRGQIQCPCHYPAAKATAAGRALQAQFAGMVR